MKSIVLLAVALWSLGICQGRAAEGAGPGSQARPNVVFVLTDDQGYGPMRAHGDVHIQTPEMDRLHGESVRFTNFHVQPNCAPTRALLFTGRPPLRNGVWATIRGRSLLRRGEKTVAESFRASGYKTALFGKWHLGDNYPFRPRDRGFEEVLIHGGGGVGNIQDYWANNYVDDHYLHNGEWKQFEGYCTEVWFEEAMKFIEGHRTEPFFVTISTNSPHLPLEAPQADLARYDGNEMVAAKRGVREFYGMVSNVDHQLGRLRAKLAELGLAENTILVFMSDNGTTMQFATWNAGMSGGKGTLTEGGHRVPFFVHWPAGGLTEGRDIDALTSGMDLRPTLEALCGVAAIADNPLDGKSLVPLLNGREPEWIDRMVCMDLQRQQQTPRKEFPHLVMQGHWRWVKGALYNLREDPAQQNDLAKLHPERVRRMEAEYARWWAELTADHPDPAAGHEIVIGSVHQNPCLLTTHDISGEVAWNHDQVLGGTATTGYWEIEVARDGEYEFALRRYPVEAGAPIRGTIPVPERLRDFQYFSRKYTYAISNERSRAWPVTSATIQIGDGEKQHKALPATAPASADHEVNAGGEVLAVRFTMALKAGVTQLHASFCDEAGAHVTAPYYIEVSRK